MRNVHLIALINRYLHSARKIGLLDK